MVRPVHLAEVGVEFGSASRGSLFVEVEAEAEVVGGPVRVERTLPEIPSEFRLK